MTIPNQILRAEIAAYHGIEIDVDTQPAQKEATEKALLQSIKEVVAPGHQFEKLSRLYHHPETIPNEMIGPHTRGIHIKEIRKAVEYTVRQKLERIQVENAANKLKKSIPNGAQATNFHSQNNVRLDSSNFNQDECDALWESHQKEAGHNISKSLRKKVDELTTSLDEQEIFHQQKLRHQKTKDQKKIEQLEKACTGSTIQITELSYENQKLKTQLEEQRLDLSSMNIELSFSTEKLKKTQAAKTVMEAKLKRLTDTLKARLMLHGKTPIPFDQILQIVNPSESSIESDESDDLTDDGFLYIAGAFGCKPEEDKKRPVTDNDLKSDNVKRLKSAPSESNKDDTEDLIYSEAG